MILETLCLQPPLSTHVLPFLSLVSSSPEWGVSGTGFCPLGRRLPLRRQRSVVLRLWWLFPGVVSPWQRASGVGITLSPWRGGDLGQEVPLHIMDRSLAK